MNKGKTGTAGHVTLLRHKGNFEKHKYTCIVKQIQVQWVNEHLVKIFETNVTYFFVIKKYESIRPLMKTKIFV